MTGPVTALSDLVAEVTLADAATFAAACPARSAQRGSSSQSGAVSAPAAQSRRRIAYPTAS
jgi:hypothetical protein